LQTLDEKMPHPMAAGPNQYDCERLEAAMERRVAIWAGLGFLVAGCWVVYTFVTPPDALLMNQPLVQTALYLTCPISYILRHYSVSWRLFLLLNAASYSVVGMILEMFRLKSKPSLVP
jgi:hypothetical protein